METGLGRGNTCEVDCDLHDGYSSACGREVAHEHRETGKNRKVDAEAFLPIQQRRWFLKLNNLGLAALTVQGIIRIIR
jgi:hypothetical protein